MSALLPYVPWLTFVAVTNSTDWRLGLAAGLIAQVMVIFAAKPRRVGVHQPTMVSTS